VRTSIIALVFILAMILSCKDNPGTGPAEIYYGEDICERCKMIISEETYSAQYTLPGGVAKKFDDLGCMIHYTLNGEAGEGDQEYIVSYYVKDYTRGEWIDGASAYYVWSPNIKTPMGHGIIAVGDENTARELSERENGALLGGLGEAASWIRKEAGK
jgi:copper chaperone NosL